MKTYSRAAILLTCLLTIATGISSTPQTLQRADHSLLIADGSGPIQTCRPGTNCGPDDTMADGSGPIRTCRPGTTCGPDDTVADGSGPIQTCRPGTNCGPDDTVRMTILSATNRLATHIVV